MLEQTTIDKDTPPVAAVYFAVLGGKFLLRRVNWSPNVADILNNSGEIIGSAQRIYSDGWSVHTRPFGGYVPDDQIVYVE